MVAVCYLYLDLAKEYGEYKVSRGADHFGSISCTVQRSCPHVAMLSLFHDSDHFLPLMCLYSLMRHVNFSPQSSSCVPQSPVQERSDTIPQEVPSAKAPEGGERSESAPSAAKGLTAHLTNDRDPESDSGLPDRSLEPNQQPQADTAGAAVESTVTVSSSPPPAVLRRRDSPSSPRFSRIPVRDPTIFLDSPSRDLNMERRHRWSSPVPGSPTHSPSPSLSCDNLPNALPRDRLSSEREDPLSLSSSSGSRSKIPRPVSATFVPEQLASKFLPRPPPGKPPSRPCVDTRYELLKGDQRKVRVNFIIHWEAQMVKVQE